MSRAELNLDLSLCAEPEREDFHWLQQLAQLMRWLGGAAIAVSLYSFLLRGWQGGDDLLRYVLLLGHTVLLAVVALGCGYFLREGKSPRLLMMLALLSVPVNFAVLGSFLFTEINEVAGLSAPSYLSWSAGSLPRTLGLTAIALTALSAVSWLAFGSLQRRLTRPLIALFLFTNLLLLIPLRDSALVFSLASASVVAILFCARWMRRQYSETKTFEGLVVQLLQFVPLVILLGRSLWLYRVDTLLLLAAALTVFILLRHLTAPFGASLWRLLAEWVSVGAALCAGVALVFLLGGIRALPDSLAIMLGVALAAGLIYELSLRAAALAGAYRCAAVALVLLVTGFDMLLNESLWTAVIAALSGAAMLIYSHQRQHYSLLIGGVLLIALALVQLLGELWQQFDFGNWLGLALSGVLTIVLASLLESKGRQMKQLYQRARRDYSAWQW